MAARSASEQRAQPLRMHRRWLAAAACALLIAGGCGDARPGSTAPKDPRAREKLERAEDTVRSRGSQTDHVERARWRLEFGDIDGATADCIACTRYRIPRREVSNPEQWYLKRGDVVFFYHVRSRVFEARRNHADALADADRAIALAEEHQAKRFSHERDASPEPLLELRGRLLFRLGRLAEADAVAATLVAGGPRTPGFEAGMGLLRMIYAADAMAARGIAPPAEPVLAFRQPLVRDPPTAYVPAPEGDGADGL